MEQSDALAAFYAAGGQRIVALADASMSPPTDGGLAVCQSWARTKLDPLGAPRRLLKTAAQAPDRSAEDAAMALVAAVRDFLGACGTDGQHDAAGDLTYQATINHRFMRRPT